MVLDRLDDTPCQYLPGKILDLRSSDILHLLTPEGHAQSSANYIASQISVWEIDFPGGADNSNVKWRAFIWAMSEGFLVLAVAINYCPPRLYSFVLKFATALCFVDFFLSLIWLPIGVSRTYGFRSAKEVFTSTCQHPTFGRHLTYLTS